MASTSPFVIKDILVVNEGKASNVPIRTGIGYLDHMIDQWNSHAQVGVGLVVTYHTNGNNNNGEENTIVGTNDDDSDMNWLARTNQVELCKAVGTALGSALREVLTTISIPSPTTGRTSRFCCPLDEALVECILSSGTATNNGDDTSLPQFHYALAPYGIYPKGVGRTRIGMLETFAIESFWRALSEASMLSISLTKLRGDNAHHIVEASFKAFSRALRNYLDSTSDLWACGSPNDLASVALHREGTIARTTKETSISVRLLLNGSSGDDDATAVNTGIPMLDAFYTTLAKEAAMTLQIQCHGDLWVDDHHTAEDVSIAIGQCLTQALGSKAGLNRMWMADASTSGVGGEEDGTTKVEVTMDLSNRPCFVHNLHETLGRQEFVDDAVGDGESKTENGGNPSVRLTCEMLEHCLDSLVMNGRMTVHIVETRTKDGNNENDLPSVSEVVLCTAKAFGRALRVCAMIDERRAGTTASSKGTLSV